MKTDRRIVKFPLSNFASPHIQLKNTSFKNTAREQREYFIECLKGFSFYKWKSSTQET